MSWLLNGESTRPTAMSDIPVTAGLMNEQHIAKHAVNLNDCSWNSVTSIMVNKLCRKMQQLGVSVLSGELVDCLNVHLI